MSVMGTKQSRRRRPEPGRHSGDCRLRRSSPGPSAIRSGRVPVMVSYSAAIQRDSAGPGNRLVSSPKALVPVVANSSNLRRACATQSPARLSVLPRAKHRVIGAVASGQQRALLGGPSCALCRRGRPAGTAGASGYLADGQLLAQAPALDDTQCRHLRGNLGSIRGSGLNVNH